MIDFIKYIDTDSLFIASSEFFNKVGLGKRFEKSNENEKIKMILDFSKVVEKYVNERVHKDTQMCDYNSVVDSFKIGFKQEIVAKSALFVRKKKYAYWCVNEEGTPTDKLSVTGLETVRSDSSEAASERLKHIMEMIIKDTSDNEIMKWIEKYKKELRERLPEEIAANIGINGISEYLVEGITPIKGTPWHVKGVANYRRLLKEMSLENKYEDIHESMKAKVLYVKKNRYGFETITFYRWPSEFDKVLQVDYETMIEKFFLKKIGFLLDSMGKKHFLEISKTENAMNTFFM